MKFSKEVKVGIIVTTGIALLFWGINFLKGRDFFTSQKLVFAIYHQVDGLSPSNVVQVNGMKIGLVKNLVLIPDNSGRILVSMHLNNQVNIPRNSVAEIYATDLLGTKGIRILFGDDDKLLQNKDTLASKIQSSIAEEVNAQVAPIKQKAENLLSSMDSVLLIIRNVFNENTKNNLKRSFESISNSLQSIENMAANMDTVLTQKGRLRTIFENLESITTNFKQNNEKVTTIINNFASISDTLAKSNLTETLENARRTLEQTSVLFDKINQGQGTLGELANNDSLYIHLNNTARDLDFLISDFTENPKRYVNMSLISIGSGTKRKKN